MNAKMNAKKLIAALAVLAASASAFAGDVDVTGQDKFVSTKSRAEVKAELAQAYAEGFRPGSIDVVEFTNVASNKTRNEVREDAIKSAKDKQFSDLYIG